MILIDTNLLIYAHISTFPQHQKSRKWLDDQLNNCFRVGLPWPSLLSFMRLVTNPRIFTNAESVTSAWKQVENWLSNDSAWIPQPTHKHQEILSSLIIHASGRPNLIPDLHLATLAIEHGLTLCSSDGDFSRFKELSWNNPLLE